MSPTVLESPSGAVAPAEATLAPAAPACSWRGQWRAIDADAEQRIERALQRKLRWRDALFRWLIEYNRY